VNRRRVTRIIALVLALIVAITLRFWWLTRRERSQDAPIRAAARRYDVDPALVKAIVWRESRFNPKARGAAQEIGLMQIREDAAREWADAEHLPSFDHEQCVDPFTNTLAGTWYLKKLLQRYTRTDDPIPFALADYNAARRNVLKWNTNAAATNSAAFMDQIGFPGTKAYILSVQGRYQRYRIHF